MSKATTPPFRVAFPSVFQPKRNTLNGKDEFSVVALFKKGEDLNGLKQAAADALTKKFGEDKSKWPQGLKTPFRDQGERIEAAKAQGKTPPQGYEQGAVYLTLRSNQRPGLVDQDVQPILDSSEFYGGCWARATVNAYAYDQAGNRGVSFGLSNLQKVKDDEHFGNRSKPEDDFAPVDTASSKESAVNATDLFN